MKNCIYFCILLFYINNTTAASPFLEGYYWRDMNGNIPDDAVPGGIDRSGNVMYMGQVLYERKLVPGKIYYNTRILLFPWDIEQKASNNIQILCSQYPENFKWIHSSDTEITQLSKKFLVKAGYQPEYYTYFGKKFINGETVVGKVVCTVNNCIGLWVALDGKQLRYNAFDVLTYEPNNN